MKVIKATDQTIDALRKCTGIVRSGSSQTLRRGNGFCMDLSRASYQGPFMAYWKTPHSSLYIAAPEGSIGDRNIAGSICTPDMMIAAHVPTGYISIPSGGVGENSLIVLKVNWEQIQYSSSMTYHLVPDPWNTCSEEDKYIAVDYLNPVTSDYPTRNPWIGLYPIARISENNTIFQLQFGNIIDYGRWWRS